MSLQACRIKGWGFKFKYDEPLFSFIKDLNKESEFLCACHISVGYYFFRELIKNDFNYSYLYVITDGMDGAYKIVLFPTEVSYIENTLGDIDWKIDFNDKDLIRTNAKQIIEAFLQRKLDREIEYLDFEHWE